MYNHGNYQPQLLVLGAAASNNTEFFEARVRNFTLEQWASHVDENYSTERITPLMKAAQHGNLAIAKRLIQNGAQVNFQNLSGNFSLKRASYQGHIAMCHLLINSGADVQMTTNAGNTALDNAVEQGHIEICQLLLGNLANVTVRTRELAIGHPQILQLLSHPQLSELRTSYGTI